MEILETLQDPALVVNFQRFCGIESNPCRPGVHQPHPHNSQVSNGDCQASSEGCQASSEGCQASSEARNGYVTQRKVSPATSNAHCSVASSNEESQEIDYLVKNRLLFYLFHFGANLGNEAFYMIFYPYFVWNFDAWVGRRICMFWGFFMYMGQATKDIIRWPRPPSPPVVRLEQRYALEYGMPSTHAMVGAGLPFSIFLFTVTRYQYPWCLGFGISLAWCCLVSLSRIYLGMHTFLDVLAGLVYVACLLPLYLTVAEPIDYFCLTHPAAPVVSILVPLAVCYCYPTLQRWSTARGDTTLVMSVNTGILLGYWFMHRYGIVQPHHLPDSPYILQWASPATVSLSLLRLMVGCTIVITLRPMLKFVILHLVYRIQGGDRDDPRTIQQLRIELPYKFVTYVLITMTVVTVVPVVFTCLGIQRDSYFTEGHTYYSQ